jgi:putative flippase GtrA
MSTSPEMTEASTSSQRRKERNFRTPLDRPIKALADRLGGSKEMERFLRFALVGISGAFLDLGLLTLLQATILPPARLTPTPFDFSFASQALTFDVTAIPMPFNVALATTLAFVAAVVSNFTWTTLWVYPESTARSMRRQLTLFALISVIGWSARTLWITLTYIPIGALMTPIVEPIIRVAQPAFDADPVMEKRIGSVIAQLVAMVFVMLWNFFANRYWTFNDVE